MYKKFEDGLVKVETGFVCIGLMLLIVTVFAAAVLRFFGIDMSWSTDLAQLAFAWVSFIGADLAMRKDRHMGVDMLTNKLPAKIQNALRLAIYCLILAFLLAGLCMEFLFVTLKYPDQKIQYALYAVYSLATASCPIGCALMSLTAVKRIVECVRRFMSNDYSYFEKKEVEA